MYKYKSYSIRNSFTKRSHSLAPLVSALMVSRGDVANITRSFEYFLAQTWPNKELVIVSPPLDIELKKYLHSFQQNIRFVEQDPSLNLGDYRNLAIANSNGDYVCQWDDDDIYSPERISAQMSVLGKSKSNAVFCEQVLIWWIEKKLIFLSAKKCWENTLLCQRSSAVVYPSIARGEDTFVARSISNHQKVALISEPSLYCYTIHGRNTWDNKHFERILNEADQIISSPEVNPNKHLEFLKLYNQNIKHG